MVRVCSDGVGRSGAFIASHAEVERMKAETVVNLFQFVKAARLQRAGLVANTVGTASTCDMNVRLIS